MSNEMMCAAEIIAACTCKQIQLAGMLADNEFRAQNGMAASYNESNFSTLEIELAREIDGFKDHWLYGRTTTPLT